MALKKPLAILGGIGGALAAREMIGRAREAELNGQVALITGGSRGLGLALARELADEGCRLAICARDEAELKRAAEDLRQRGAEVLTVRCDVSDKDDVNRMVASVEEEYGQIDLLVCNAGVMQVGQFQNMELADFEQAMDIMYWGVLYPILAVLPGMRARGEGRIANVTSIGGKVSVPRMLPYNSAKFAAVGLSEGLRAELADEGIAVTTIAPGLTRTGSYLQAEFSGDEEGRAAHYGFFAPLASLPLMTGDAERGAEAYVRAIKRGMAEYTYPPQFGLVTRIHGVAPATTMWALSLADRLLPKSGEGTETERGASLEGSMNSRAWHAATAPGRKGAEDHLQHASRMSDPGLD